tara:strand:+ start:102 stop:308 length:207 start_codon:yes stop_codon:yes gene_type:complete
MTNSENSELKDDSHSESKYKSLSEIEVEFLDEMEELIVWNLSFGVSMRETLREIKRLDLMDFFSYLRV